jgi:hypothetical protein
MFKRWRSPWAQQQKVEILVIMFFVLMLQVTETQDDKKLGSLLSCLFFGSSVGGPHGHDKEFNSSLSRSFVLVLQLSQMHDNKEFDSSSSFFFVQVLEVPMGMTTRSSIFRHHALLFQCCKSIKRTTMRNSVPHCCVFYVLVL